MNMKRVLVFLVLGLFLISMMGGVLGVNGDTSAEKAAEKAGEKIGAELMSFVSFIKALFGAISGEEETVIGKMQVFTQILFTILIAMLVYSSSGFFFEEGSFVHWTATIAISLLAIIAIPVNLLEVIRVQYGVMGATLITAIPFAIVAFFTIKVENLAIAYMTWVFFIMYYFFLFISKVVETKSILTVAALPYTLAIVAGFVMIFILAFFRKWLAGVNLEADVELARQKTLRRAAGLEEETARLKATTGI